jgi:hypothetical protein
VTSAGHHASPAAPTGDDAFTTELWNAIPPEFLASVEWSVDRQILVFPRDHAVLGWRECIVPGCDQKVLVSEGLCAACNLRWKQQDRPDIADFVRVPRVRRHRRVGADPCVVAVCARSARAATGLCGAHERARKRRHLAVEVFLKQPALEGFATLGECAVRACTRERATSSSPYCTPVAGETIVNDLAPR